MKGIRVQEIKTMVVFAGEEGTCKSLLKGLQEGYYVTIPAWLKSHDIGTAYAVINISFERAKIVFGKCKLPSFVFTHLIEDNSICSELWETVDCCVLYDKGSNPYVKKEETSEWKFESGTEGRYTVIGSKFQYSVSASMFEAVRAMLYDRLVQIEVSEKKHGRNVDADYLLDYSIYRVGMTAYLRRKAINNNIINKINQHGSN